MLLKPEFDGHESPHTSCIGTLGTDDVTRLGGAPLVGTRSSSVDRPVMNVPRGLRHNECVSFTLRLHYFLEI
jgi:hypothetical protein